MAATAAQTVDSGVCALSASSPPPDPIPGASYSSRRRVARPAPHHAPAASYPPTHPRRATSPAVAACAAAKPDPASMAPTDALDWESLTFGIQNAGPFMYKATATAEGEWEGGVVPFGPVELNPSAQVLNYGQSIFEGMKAQRAADGSILLFRPDRNAQRMRDGAKRMCMKRVPEDDFVRAVAETVTANASMVPPHGKGALYLRPLLMGSGAILGLGPAPAYTFVVFCAPVGSYFKGGQLTPLRLLVEERYHRSAPRGMGGTKAAGNYSPVLITQTKAKADGFADVLYLDAREDKYVEEVASCNVFVVKDGKLATPPAGESVLPGVTRASILELARDLGYEAEERPVSIQETLQADEVFTTGTAVVLASVGSIMYKGQEHKFGGGSEAGPLTKEMYRLLTGIQTRAEGVTDAHGWAYPVWEASG